jgi:ATP-dependent Lon protease
MELIEVSGYITEEKIEIARKHLIPKELEENGFSKNEIKVSKPALEKIIESYTRESGVRELDKKIGKIFRKIAYQYTSKGIMTNDVKPADLTELLGTAEYSRDKYQGNDYAGVVTGLAWTAVGGEILFIETSLSRGKGSKLTLTGNLGDVMKESAHAAMSYIRSRAGMLNLPPDFYKTKDIHVHFPEGAVPKDGPSAGITVCTAMVSALTGAPVRRDIAMTGEISIRGRVLPIGGLKEKTMAALRHGIKTVIIPEKNEKDLEEIDQTVRNALNFITVSHVDAVLSTALDFSKCPNQVPQRVEEPMPDLLPTKKAKKSTKTEIRQ